jgi:hypothetical protein
VGHLLTIFTAAIHREEGGLNQSQNGSAFIDSRLCLFFIRGMLLMTDLTPLTFVEAQKSSLQPNRFMVNSSFD